MGARNQNQGQFVAPDTRVSALGESGSRHYIANLCLLFSNLRKGKLHYIRPVGRSISRHGVTLWSWYWSRDRYRDHFGLENVLQTSLVTPYSVTFWSRNGLQTGLETILVSKTVSRSGLVTQCSVGRSVGWLVSPFIFLPFLLYNKLEQKKNKDHHSSKRFALFTWSSLCMLFILTSWITRNINSLFLSFCLISGTRLNHGATYSLYQSARKI